MINKHQNGFIALISAIIISALLLIITMATSMAGIFGRFNILDSESKERSLALAEACVDTAIMETTTAVYSTNKDVFVGPNSADKCRILSVELNQPTVGQTRIITQSIINKAYTTLTVVIDTDYNIISWEETATYP